MKLRRILLNIKRNFWRYSRPALNDLDRELQKYLNFNNGFFIEVGAYDGYTQSNTYFLEKRRGWNGLLIEGIPNLYKKCKKNRPKSIVKNFALVSNDFSQSSVEMHYADLMSVVEGALKSEVAQKRHIDAGMDLQYFDSSYKVTVPARTLESVLTEISNLPDIDFFSLDVEGYELQVLKGLNLDRYKPRYILVEAKFFEEVNEFLLSYDYQIIGQLTHHDFLYESKRIT